MTLINLTGTDLVGRIRRFCRAVGKLSPAMEDKLVGEISLINLGVDPYQRDYNTWAANALQGAAAGLHSSVGVIGLAPVTVVRAVSFTVAAAGQQVQIQVQRPSLQTGVIVGAAPLNNGGLGVNQVFKPFATLLAQTGGGPTGPTVDLITVDTLRTVLYVPPVPIVLYSPPFNGALLNSGLGDQLIISNTTLNAAMSATFFWEEYPNFTPN